MTELATGSRIKLRNNNLHVSKGTTYTLYTSITIWKGGPKNTSFSTPKFHVHFLNDETLCGIDPLPWASPDQPMRKVSSNDKIFSLSFVASLKDKFLRVTTGLHVLFHVGSFDSTSDKITEEAIAASVNFVGLYHEECMPIPKQIWRNMSGVMTTAEYNRAYIIVCIFFLIHICAHLDTLNRNKCISTAYYICRGAASKLRTWQAWGYKRRHPDHQIKDIQCCLKLAKLFTLVYVQLHIM